MKSSVDTAALRCRARCWSLAGDKCLLEVMEKIHQKIICKCEETNSSLTALATALDDADIALQTVNNRIMSLSNSQFVESRVYEDEVAAAEDTRPREEPKAQERESDLSTLKRGISTLERMHSAVEILRDSDSDSDSESDAEFYTCRVVLKPNDMYADRPLPHIIGSHAWKTKWHAGLYPEESETETESESEEEMRAEPIAEVRTNIAELPDRPVSSSSSGVVAFSPAEVAASVARRLAGDIPQISQREIEYSPPQPTLTKEYKPQPIAVRGPIFLDEPPPLEQTHQSDEDDYGREDDIFAELHKNKPNNTHINRAQSSVTDDLFGDIIGNIEGLFGRGRENEPKVLVNRDQDTEEKGNATQEKDDVKTFAKQKSTLFEDNSDAELFAEQSDDIRNAGSEGATQGDVPVKKPVGGISLFGSNKGAESIGAAIMRRTRRKSSVSSDEIEDEIPKVPKEETQSTEKQLKTEQNDFLENLFAKSEKSKPVVQNTKIATEAKIIEKSEKKIDLFSDDLFDDMDDIFTSNVVVKIPKKEMKKTEKYIFEDENDLFADIAVSKTPKQSVSNVNIKKEQSLFDSDDELFSEKNVKKQIVRQPPTSSNAADDKDILKQSAIKPVSSESRSFDTSSDDDIFSNVKQTQSRIKNADIPKESHAKEIATSIYAKESQDSVLEYKKSPPMQTYDFTTPKYLKQTQDCVENNDRNYTFSDESAEHTNNYSISSKDNSQQSHEHLIKPTEINDGKENEFAHSPSVFSAEDDIFVPQINENTPIMNTDTFSETVFETDLVNDKSVEPNEKRIKDGSDKLRNCDDNTKLNKVSYIKSPSIFDDDDDLFQSQIVKEELPDPLADLSKPSLVTSHKSKSAAIKPDENSQNTTQGADLVVRDFVNVTKGKKTSTMFSDPAQLLSTKTDALSDIFDEAPPLFEKPKEPKKSKNINALFDDDSDDEALFFKTNDVDEKLEDFTNQSTEDKLFDIFHDEPPDIDIDFIQKPINNQDISKNLNKTSAEFSEDMINQTKEEKGMPSTSTTLEKKPVTNLPLDDIDSRKEIQIGKLKPTNLNININTLLPGVSPKKLLRVAEQIDGLSFSTKSDETNIATSLIKNEISTESTKNVTFEKGNPEILDNNFSKQRAKIQIKRRPSTRHARREAVRKSMIDVGEESTDNSSSIDDTPKNKQVYQKPYSNKAEIFNTTDKTSVEVTSKTVYILNDEDIFSDTKTVANKPVLKNENEPKTKTLQIIDDEDDIFKTTKADSKFPVIDNNSKGSVNTLGKVYEEKSNVEKPIESIRRNVVPDIQIRETNKENPKIVKDQIGTKIKENSKKSLFDDLSDEESELFGGSKTPAKSKLNILYSGSENQLFSGTSKNETVNKKETVEVKRSLFGDDDDEDLFNVKDTRTESAHHKPSASVESRDKQTNNSKTEQDPLTTLLGNH